MKTVRNETVTHRACGHQLSFGSLSFVSAEKEQTSPSRLRMIVRHGVVNERTRMVIWQAAREPAMSRTRQDGYKEYFPPDQGFFALLRSVNGSSTMRMLLDHKDRIGYKTVMNIIVFACNSAADADKFEKHRTFMIVLSNERRPMELPQASRPPVPEES